LAFRLNGEHAFERKDAGFPERKRILSFESLGLRDELLRALATENYTTPTPIQTQAIPMVLEGRDVLAAAQTGTGKTAAFTLPILQRLMDAPRTAQGARRPVRCLIVTPTRELAAQIEESVNTYGRNLPLAAAVVYGGVNIRPQILALQRGVDILVATPGRLLDHVQQRTVDLSRVEVLVLDEADRMLDMGFIRDIRRIISLLPTKRQNLLFSATFTDDIRGLADGILRNAVSVEVARKTIESDLVSQSVYLTAKENKRDLLVHLLVEKKIRQALVFTRTKHGADRLAQQLRQDGIRAVPIHGNRSQAQRTRALADFKAGTENVLVATDIAARGLDIDQLQAVVNFELPHVPEDYVHRIGRTGRAGSQGEAFSLVSGDEQAYLAGIERLLRRRLDRPGTPEFTPSPRPAVAEYRPEPGPSGRARGRSPRAPQGPYGGQRPQGGSRYAATPRQGSASQQRPPVRPASMLKRP
jgi:ATP-dependent RNA helicase RhlE